MTAKMTCPVCHSALELEPDDNGEPVPTCPNSRPHEIAWCPRCQCNSARSCVCSKDCQDHPKPKRQPRSPR